MLTDAQWNTVKDFCPSKKYNSANKLDSRRFLDVVLHLARTGERWRDLPASLGNSMSLLSRFVIWNLPVVSKEIPYSRVCECHETLSK
jgi:transposase